MLKVILKVDYVVCYGTYLVETIQPLRNDCTGEGG